MSPALVQSELPGHTVELLQELQDIAELEGEWRTLANRMCSPIVDFPWFWSALTTLHRSDAPHILTVRRDGQLVGVAPLTGQKSGLGLRLEIIGTQVLGEPSGILYQDASALDALCQALVHLAHPLSLFRVQNSDLLHAPLRKAARGRCLLAWRQSTGAPWADLSQGFDAYLATRSARRRSDLRRAERRLREIGTYAVKVRSPSVDDLQSQLDRLLAVECRSWKGRNGSAILKKPGLEQFVRAYCERATELGILRLCSLEVAGEIAAMQIAVEQNNRFWVLKIGYDEKFARASPGLLLTLKTMQKCALRGLETYEFLGFDEPWLAPWSDGLHEYALVMSYPVNLSGLICLFSDGRRYISNRFRRLSHTMTNGERRARKE